MMDWEGAKISSIIIIESLFVDDYKTGTELFNDTVKRYIEFHKKTELRHELHEVSSKDEFVELINTITENIESYPPGLLIHIEAHGASDQSGIIFTDRSLALWKILQDAFISLNVKLNNQLYVSLATCFGRNFYLTVDLNKKAPFRAFISSSKKMTVGEILRDYGYLMEELIETGDLIEAYNKADLKGTNYYYKDARTVVSESFYSIDEKLKDPTFKKEFMKKYRKDWDRLKVTENLPDFDSMDTESFIKMAKINMMNNITKNFFFDGI